ncbi:MAG: DEAD/DEAH box helicase [Ignavibacteriae bacterium]|nr:DEAD/DEAH box helicase [Ignavibacteriota bacterium]
MSIPDRVRLLHDPTRIGVLTGREQYRRERKLVQVQFSDGLRWVAENKLEYISEIRLSPLDMLERRKLGRAIDIRRTLTHVKLSGRLADVIYSMEATNTEFYAYQFKPVIKILESPSNGILLADEVGLGKTIEAGLVWTELRSRFDMRRLVVICPAALREKWRRELTTRFGVSAQISNASDCLKILSDDNSRVHGFALILSIQGIRPQRRWEDADSKKPNSELARYLSAMENEEKLVDLLIVDEAHHLRNPETQTNEIGQLFKNVSDYTILLTATPIHNRNEDLFSLLNLIDPDTFTRVDVLNQILEANAPLVAAREHILGHNPNSHTLRQLLEKAQESPLLQTNRQLLWILETDIQPDNLKRLAFRSRLASRIETVNLLAHVITRTRKRDVLEWQVVRDPRAEFVNLSTVESNYYNLVSAIVIEYAAHRHANERFLLAQPQRQMTSSMPASLSAWQKRLIEVEEADYSDNSDDDKRPMDVLGPLVTEIVRRSHDYVELSQLIKYDSKYKRLIFVLAELLKQNPREKIVVFSTFRATLDYLRGRLNDDGINCIILKGGQKESKDDVITRFKSSDGPSVLLSSEVGGEGVDLQFSRIVINYDLPWNPMRIEQRIGRIDRLGQSAEKVIIWNILYANTIDARIYSRLYEKLDLCRTALGDYEAMLGEVIRKLEMDLLSLQLTAQEQELRIDLAAQVLESRRQAEQRLEKEAAHLIAYGDYILSQVHAARELNRWITSTDIKNYVFDYLRLHFPGCELLKSESDNDIYDIELSNEAKSALSEYIKTNKISVATRLTMASSRPVRCCFINRSIDSSKNNLEAITQFHPLVRMICSRISESDEQLTPAVAINIDKQSVDSTINTGLYIVAVALWSFHGLQDTEKLAYAGCMFDSDHQLLPQENAEKMALAAVQCGQDWLEARNIVDLDLAYKIINETLFAELDEEYEEYAREISAKNHDRADIQLRTLEQHLRQQEGKLLEIRSKHYEHGRESLVKATEGRIRALRNSVDLQRLGITRRREINSESREIAVAIINIK